jgi:hypothetical protein
MKASLLTAILLSMCVPCWAQENKAPIETTHWQIAFPLTSSSKNAAPKTATAQQIIPDGTVVSVSLNAAIRSDEFRAGQQVALTVNEPVIVNGFTMIKSGTQAMAHVEQVDKAGAWARGGKIAWVIDDVLAINGARVPLRFSDKVMEDNSTA